MHALVRLRAIVRSGSALLLLAALTPSGLHAQETKVTGEAAASVSATELQAAIDAIRRQVAEQKAERESSGGGELAAELRAARDAIAELTRSTGLLRDERDALMAELQAQRETARGLQASVAAAGQREVEAREALAQALEEAKVARAEVEAERVAAVELASQDADRIAALEAELATAATSRDATAADLEAARAALEEQSRAHQAKVAELEASLTAAGDAALELQVRLDQEGRLLAAATQARDAAEGRAIAAEQSLAQANDATTQLELELVALREVASNSVIEVQGIGEQLLASLRENDELGAALEQARASRAALEQELAAMRQDIQIYVSELAAMRDGGAEGPVALVASDAIVETLDAELATAREQMRALNEELIARDKQLVALGEAGDADALAQRLGLLERELETAQAENARLVDELAGLRAADQPETPEVLVASAAANGNAESVLGQLDAVDTGDGWWMTVPDGLVFAPGSGNLAPGAEQALAQVAALLGYFDGAPVRIVGHTDSYGDAAVNRELSLLRANAVRNVLVADFGVDPKRVETEGLGEDRPVSSNGTIEGRRANRRVEIYVRRGPLDG
ncbi:MAG: OmpA family protein [Geminicoccaceae bacterium]|nr:OmpA family protein [Geminicoccaceae bacterium]MCB9966506.1 OmpA family protein [Geminicoccaceae bacterium]HRY26515.1 OmpA family protein [Geminicoccaceae bacterium]